MPLLKSMDQIKKDQDLFAAASDGNHEKLMKLLDFGASIEAESLSKKLFCCSRKYLTPLQVAAAEGHLKCVKLLIAHKANVNAMGSFGATALHMAARMGHLQCLVALLKAGADINVATKCNTYPCVVGSTALHLATQYHQVACIEELICNGADYNAVDINGCTSLYIAAERGFSDCVLLHLKKAQKTILSLPSVRTSDTPLHFAVKYSMGNCVRQLVLSGSDVDHVNREGYTPLHYLLTQFKPGVEQLELLRLFVLKGYNVNINRPVCDLVPLMYAKFSISPFAKKMARFLISYGAEMDVITYDGSKILEYELLSYEKKYDILKYMVRNMLQLPHISSLNLCGVNSTVGEEMLQRIQGLRIWHYRTYVNVPEILLAEYKSGLALEFSRQASENLNLQSIIPVHAYNHQNCVLLSSLSLMKTIYDALELFIEKCKKSSVETGSRYLNLYYYYLVRKQLWYEISASTPRTLMHSCRYSIRKSVGAANLKNIWKLPVPSLIHSYLLLDWD